MDIIDKLFNPSITDWIQAIASCIAVLGAIAAFASLFRKDIQKQEQIQKLTSLAAKIDTQNEILMEQLKISITPFFKKIKNPPIEGRHGFILLFTNNGEIALNVKVEPNNETEVEIGNNTKFQFEISNHESYVDKMNDIIISVIRILDFSIPIKYLEYSFKIIFDDKMKNKYYQIVKGKEGDYFITEPIRIE
jgi:hypothetical protein